MSAGDYAYVNAKIGALRSWMLTPGEYRSLCEAASLEECMSLLKATHLGKGIAKLGEEPEIPQVEALLFSELASEYGRLVQGVRKEAKMVLQRLYRKFVADTVLKPLLRLKSAGVPQEALQDLFYPSQPLPKQVLAKLLGAEDVREMVESLRDTVYHKPLAGALSAYQEAGVAALTTALDGALYRELWSSTGSLSTKDRRIARDFIGREVDMRNVLTAFRLRGSEFTKLEQQLIPVSYRVGRDVLAAILSVRHLSQLATEIHGFAYHSMVAALLKEYENIARELPLGAEFMPASQEAPAQVELFSVLPFELALRRQMLGAYRGAFRGDRFHIGVPMAHLFLRENEIRNVVTILKLKEAGAPAEGIEKALAM